MSPPNSPTSPLPPPKSGVTVRMYNTGFGDCFLLAFRAQDGTARYMLIDCGVHHNYAGGAARMKPLAKDIASATGSHLHVVAVTHEHTDHLYGFKHAGETFEKFKMDQLWLAWTEDPTDADAMKLKKRFGMRFRALKAAVSGLKAANRPLADTLEGMLGFEFPNALSATGGNVPQLKFLRTKSKKKLLKSEDYRRPEEDPLTLPDVEGVKVYILAPPRDPELIKELEKESELYPKLTAMNELNAFAAAALGVEGLHSLKGEDRELFDRSRPFDTHEIPIDEARKHPEYGQFFKEHYGFAPGKGDGPKWRRIDADWLAGAEQLALSINDETNNTSLVLAIELTESQPRKVLLFAADAQVGNWLSWQKLSWPKQGPDGEEVDGPDLLRRTVLYKVGHHGSHNATLKEKGLEMMESGDLVAMIPVDEGWAYSRKPQWKHPAKKLLKRLKEKTGGRIIRTDKIPSGDKPPKKPSQASKSEWKAFVKQLDWDRGPNKLWIQYTVTE